MGKTITGIVSSNSADKTIVITVTSRKTDPLYKKQYTVRTKFIAHDEKNLAKLGDKVSIVETRPISARKRYSLEKVLNKASVGFKDSDATADVVEEPKIKAIPTVEETKKAVDKVVEETKE